MRRGMEERFHKRRRRPARSGVLVGAASYASGTHQIRTGDRLVMSQLL